MSIFAQWQIGVCLGNQFESIFPVPFNNISGLKIVQQSLFLYFPDKYAFTAFTLPLKCLWWSSILFLFERKRKRILQQYFFDHFNWNFPSCTISNKYGFFSIHQRIKFSKKRLSGTTVFNIYSNVSRAANQHIRVISEGSCNTEDWSNDENSAVRQGINSTLKQFTIENSSFKLLYYLACQKMPWGA